MHFLKKDEMYGERAVGRPYAAVKVRLEGKSTLRIAEGICVLKFDTLLVPLPTRITVVGPNGETVRASRRLYCTTETLDPWHLVTDMA